MIRLKRILILWISCLLVGCGFHLRGMIDMPQWVNHVAIIIETGHRDLESLLRVQFESYHIQLDENIHQAQYWLVIEQDREEQHITSVSSSTTPRQYQITYSVRYKFQKANGQEIIPSSLIVLTRQITINSDRILGSNDEENKLKKEMRRDAAIQIIERISAQK